MRFALSTITVVLLWASTAGAATITQSRAIDIFDLLSRTGTTDGDLLLRDKDGLTLIGFDQFNPLLGVLTSVEVRLESTMNGTGGVSFIRPEFEFISRGFVWSMTMNVPGDTVSSLPSTTTIATCGASGACRGTQSVTTSFVATRNPPAALFIGSGTWDALLRHGLQIHFIGGPNRPDTVYTSAIDLRWTGTLAATYQFTPLPEPSTLTVALGIGAMAWWRRRDRAKDSR